MQLLPSLFLGFLLLAIPQDADLPVGSELKLVMRDRSVIRGKLTEVDGRLLKLLTPLGTKVRVDRGDIARFEVSGPAALLKPPSETDDRAGNTSRTVDRPARDSLVVFHYEVSDQGDLTSDYEVEVLNRHESESLDHYRLLLPGKALEVTTKGGEKLRFCETSVGSLTRCKIQLFQPLQPGRRTTIRVRVLERRRIDIRSDEPALQLAHRFDRDVDLEIALRLPDGLVLAQSDVVAEDGVDSEQLYFRRRLRAGEPLRLKLHFER
ncbi:MAG: hypothetical protein RL885_15380 [Planctomycetota bacterium]